MDENLSSSSGNPTTDSWAWWKYSTSSSSTPWHRIWGNRGHLTPWNWRSSSSTPDYWNWNWHDYETSTPWSWGKDWSGRWGTTTYFPEWTEYPGWYVDCYVWDWNSSRDALWYMDHFNFAGVSMSVFQIIGALVSLFINISLIMMALAIRDVPKLVLFPVILNAFFNIICSGLVNLASTIFTLVAHYIYYMDGPWASGLTDFLWYNPGLVCARDFLLMIVSEYSTGFCILALAVERFASVCVNSRKTTRGLKISRRLICLSLTVIVTLLLGMAAYASSASYHMYSCVAHYYSHQYSSVVIDGFLFFLAPAMMSACLYSLVGIELVSKECVMKKRDKILTFGFIISFGIWIFFWAPKWVYELKTLNEDIYNYYTAWSILEMWGTVYIPFQLGYSLVSPSMVLLVIVIAGRVGKKEKDEDMEKKLTEEKEKAKKEEGKEEEKKFGEGACGMEVSDQLPEKLRVEWEAQLQFNSPTFY